MVFPKRWIHLKVRFNIDVAMWASEQCISGWHVPYDIVNIVNKLSEFHEQ